MLRLVTLASKWQFSRYTAVGLLAAAAYVVIATALRDVLFVSPWLASAIAYLMCIPFAYLGQKRLAFRSDQPHAIAFPRYCGVQVINTIVSSALSETFSRAPHLPDFVIFALSGAIVIVGNYLFLSRWAFRPQ